jgi:hypothetical protein
MATAAPRVEPDSEEKRRRATSRTNLIVTLVLAVLILIPSMLGFITKFIELIAVLRGDPDGVFTLTPIVNYLLASLGFFCLLIWAISRGMFRDVEQPKQAMLERESELEASEAPIRRADGQAGGVSSHQTA